MCVSGTSSGLYRSRSFRGSGSDVVAPCSQSGERLYSDSPLTWTRCRDKATGGYPAGCWGLFFGGSQPLLLATDYDDDGLNGVAGLRKFGAVSPSSLGDAVIDALVWERYFGEVGVFPALPADIAEILSSPCPFWEGKQVRDTHLLALIPSRVGGKALTLDYLGELIQSPKGGGHETEYRLLF